MDIWNIWLNWFAFLLLILCVGYVFVEALWPKYNHKYIADTTFERWLQYIIWWVLSQILTIYVIVKSQESLIWLQNILDSSSRLVQWLPEQNQLQVQLFALIVAYFYINITVVSIIWILIRRIGWFIESPEKRIFWRSIEYLIRFLSSLPIPMLHLVKFVNKITHHFTMFDWTVAKIDLIIVGLLLAKLFPVLTSAHWGYYVAVIVLAEIYFIRRISSIVKK